MTTARTATMGTRTIFMIDAPVASETADALPLLIWLSPAFPVGAFAYSQGLEWAIEDGTITDGAGLEDWIRDTLAHGAIRADSVLLAATIAAPGLDDRLALNELALALAPSAERQLETGAQGTAFLTAVRTSWPASEVEAFVAAVAEGAAAYPVAVGIAAAAHGMPRRATLEAFALAAVANLVSAALRLGPIGQTEAQAITARLVPAIRTLAAEADGATLGDLGTASWCADIASMRHETQYSRLFRS